MLLRIIIATLATLTGCSAGNDTRSTDNRGNQNSAAQDPAGPLQGQALTSGILTDTYTLFPRDLARSQAFSQRFPVYRDSQVAFLNPGADFYNARMKLLDQATKSVRMQYLLFHGDEAGWRVAEKLVELKNKGIDIHVIIDDLSNYSIEDQKLYFYLRRNGIVIEGWEFLFLNIIGTASETNDFGVSVDNANRRYHDKLFIVDGEDLTRATAIMGGANIGNNYYRVAHDDPIMMWHDSEVIIKGPVVQKITHIYDENLAHFRAKRKYAGSSAILWAAVNAIFSDAEVPDDLNNVYLARLDAIAQQPFNPVWHQVPMRFIQSRPRKSEDYIYPVYIDLIESAQSEIMLSNAYFVPDEQFIDALKRAAHRGVNVHIMTNTKETIDFPQVVVVGRTLYKNILAANNEIGQDRVFIHEWGGDEFLHNGEGQNHSKYLVIDRKQILVGSYNIDPRSRYLNSETVLVYEGQAAVHSFTDQYLRWMGPQWTLPVTMEKALAYDDPDNLKDAFDLMVASMIKPYL